MAQQLNEQFVRMQKLAGVITEGEYKMKMEAISDPSPEEATEQALQYADEFAQSPELEQLANKIANNPQMFRELQKVLAKGGVPTQESMNGLDPNKMRTFVLNFARKSEDLSESTEFVGKGEGASSVGKILSFVFGLFGGASLTSAVVGAIGIAGIATPLVIAAGAVALYVVAEKVYQKITDPDREARINRFKQDVDDISKGKVEPLRKMSSTTSRRTSRDAFQQDYLTENDSPEEVADLVVNKHLPKLVPGLEMAAEKIASDPQAMKELARFMEKQGIAVSEGDVNISDDIFKRVAAKYAAMASQEQPLTEEDYGWQFWVGFLGGGSLARYISNVIQNTPDHARMGAAILGGLAAAALLYVGTYIYDKLKD